MKKKRIICYAGFVCLCFCVFAQNNVKTNFRMELHKNRGTFKISSINQFGTLRSLLDLYDENTTSFFSLKIGRSVYKLMNHSVEGYQIDLGGGKLVYTIPRKATVELEFVPISSQSDGMYDMIKAEAIVTNTAAGSELFSLKAIFDTFLGERTGNHFSTAEIDSINSEMQFMKMEKLKYVSSSDKVDTINFLFYGDDITEPEYVTLGNKDALLNGSSWIPLAVENRPFNSIVTYNNSALCVNWSEVILEAGKTFSTIFYMSIASDGQTAATSVVKKDVQIKAALTDRQIEIPQKEDAVHIQEPEIEPEALPLVVAAETAPASTTSFQNLDVKYIQALLDRISELEMDGKNTNADEIMRLSEEIDIIFEMLRWK